MLVLAIKIHDAFWSRKALICESPAHSANVGRSSISDSLSPEVHAEVACLHWIIRNSVLAVFFLKARHEIRVLLALDTLEIIPGRIIARHLFRVQAAQFILGEAE